MVHAQRQFSAVLFCLLLATAASAQDDPPSRVLRLNYTNGNVSMEPAGIDDWAPAVVNRPFGTDDYLYTDSRAVAELHTDSAAIRMGEYTNAGVLNLTDTLLQLKLTQGDMYFRLRDLQPDEALEIDTPNAAINLQRAGVYRIHVDPNANTTFVVAREGQAEITAGGQALTLNAGDAVNLAGTESLAYSVVAAPAPDVFDSWCAQRDARFESAQATQYVPPSVIGYEDLQDHGVWNETPDYGAVWVPNGTPAGWAPYRDGHWAWIEPWGWTWVDDAPWGFAPFHYGRWVYWHDRWGWAPGPVVVARGGDRGPVRRPIYAPAMVAWFGGAHWGVSVAIGSAPSVGWVPLGWGEVYTPCYHVSPHYFSNVNIYNTRIVNNVNITNVYRTVYVNKAVYNQTFVNVHAPNAVVAMRQEQFASGRPVRESAIAFRQDQLAHFNPGQASVVAPRVAPSRQAVLTTLGRPAARPPQAFFERAVIARATPAAAVAPFAARQAFLQQHAGQPHDFAQMHQSVGAPAVRQVALVRQAPPAQPVAVQPGQHLGDAHAHNGTFAPNRPAGAPEMQGSAVPNNGNSPAQQSQARRTPEAKQHGMPPNSPAFHGNEPRVQPQESRLPPQPAARNNYPPESRQPAPVPHVQEPQPHITEPHNTEPRNSSPTPHAEEHNAPSQHVQERPEPHGNAPAQAPHVQDHSAAPPQHEQAHHEQGHSDQHDDHKDAQKPK